MKSFKDITDCESLRSSDRESRAERPWLQMPDNLIDHSEYFYWCQFAQNVKKPGPKRNKTLGAVV